MNYGIPQGKPQSNQQNRVKIIAFIIVGMFFIWFIFIRDSTESMDINSLNSEAYVASEDFVKLRLKSPASADFPGDEGHVTYLGDSLFMIKSYVDAQNAFGANLRNYYTAKVKYTADHKWYPVEVNLESR